MLGVVRVARYSVFGLRYAVCGMDANPMVCVCYRSYIYVVVFILPGSLVHWFTGSLGSDSSILVPLLSLSCTSTALL